PWKEKSDADIARAIAKQNDFETGDVDDTSIEQPLVPQDNKDDHAFLLERAKRVNFELFVRDDKLHFRKPRESESPKLTLVWGSSLVSFAPSLTLAKQVTKVTVRGWDHEKGTLIEKTVDRKKLAEITAKGQDAGKILENALGGEEKEEVIVSEGVLSKEDA